MGPGRAATRLIEDGCAAWTAPAAAPSSSGAGPATTPSWSAGLGFATTAFDIAETAVAIARRRFPGSRVDYRVADLLDPPAEWAQAFDLVLESITVQSMPVSSCARRRSPA